MKCKTDPFLRKKKIKNYLKNLHSALVIATTLFDKIS